MPRHFSAELARHMAEARFADLSEPEVEAARLSLVDVIGCALAARGAPELEPVLAVARAEGGREASTAWPTGERMAPRQAGFVNSVAAALLDYDSVFHAGVVHSDCVVVPTAVAVGEAAGCSGDALLAAIAFGNDMLCRLSLIARPPRRAWFFTSVVGVVAAAAVTARLLGGSAAQVLHAMGLALLNAGGTYQPMAEQSASKQAMAAFAVQSGIHCGYLAAAGFPGISRPIEGEHGLLAMYQDGDPDVALDGLGRVFYGSQAGRKPYPSCQCNHAPIEAVLDLLQANPLAPGDIEGIEVHLSPHAARVVGAPYDAATATQMAAQFSVRYSVACALVRRRFGIEEVKPPTIADPEILAMARHVLVRVVDPANSGTYVPATVILRMTGGREMRRTISVNRGGVERPLTVQEMRLKFADCLRSATPTLAATAADETFARLVTLRDVSDLATVLAATRAGGCSRSKRPVRGRSSGRQA